MNRLLAFFAMALLLGGTALAQTPGPGAGRWLTVTTCGTMPDAYVTGGYNIPTIDTEGVVCTNASGGGGAGDASAANQTTEIASIDAVETAVDGLETLVTATNAAVDGIEALIALTNGYVDGIEGFVDGIEALIGTTNSTLTTIDGRVDGLETLVTSTNTKIDTLDGSVDAITTAVTAGTIPTATTLSFLSVNNTTGVTVKASAGTLLHVDCYTTPSATVPLFLKFYNVASAPTCGAGTIVRRVMIPLNTTGGTGVSLMTGGVAGQAFGTGISYCLTAGVANADTTAPAANVAVCNIDYN